MTEQTTLAVMDGAATETWARTILPAPVMSAYDSQQLVRALTTSAWDRLRVPRASKMQRGG